MTARSNIKMARTVLSVGALALAAVTFALPVGAKPKQTPYQECVANCWHGDAVCLEQCRFWFGATTTKKAAVSRARRPVTGTGAATGSTRLHASATRGTGPVLHGGYTNPTGPTLPTTVVHRRH